MTQQPSLALAHRLAIASKDMAEALAYLIAIEQMGHSRAHQQPWPPQAGLLVAAVVVYARPFIRSHSGGIAVQKLDADALHMFAGRDPMRALHKRLLDYRDEAVAHGDWKHHQASLAPGSTVATSFRETLSPDYIGMIEVGKFKQLVSYVHAYCEAKMSEEDRVHLQAAQDAASAGSKGN